MTYIYFSLADLEGSRDDLLFEIHNQPAQSATDRNVMYDCFFYIYYLPLKIILMRCFNSSMTTAWKYG